MGVTFFTENIYQEEIYRVLESQNRSAMIPFSSEPARIAAEVLRLHGFSSFADDDILKKFFASRRKTCTLERALEVLNSNGLFPVAVLPTGYSKPYSTFFCCKGTEAIV